MPLSSAAAHPARRMTAAESAGIQEQLARLARAPAGPRPCSHRSSVDGSAPSSAQRDCQLRFPKRDPARQTKSHGN
jgi:hypothetical protein